MSGDARMAAVTEGTIPGWTVFITGNPEGSVRRDRCGVPFPISTLRDREREGWLRRGESQQAARGNKRRAVVA